VNASGPVVVAIGGGHGLAGALKAIRSYASQITAVVSVADDGGSSGRLRELLAIPAPGDVRRCLGALLPEPSSTLLNRALEHRFEGGELDGHAFGNLMIAALAAAAGDFVAGVTEACRLLGTVGAVYPATEEAVVLKAELDGGGDSSGGTAVLEGQVRIMTTAGVRRISLVPPDACPPQQVLDALAHADQIVIGPGSLYTSVLAACAPPRISEAIRASSGVRIYVANLREQVPETSGYDVAAHVRGLARHGIDIDLVVADVRGIALGDLPDDVAVWSGPLADSSGLCHDAQLLSAVLERVHERPHVHGAVQKGHS